MREIFSKAADLVEVGWCQGVFARRFDGSRLIGWSLPYDPAAGRWCIAGAIRRAVLDGGSHVVDHIQISEVERELRRILGMELATWNDAPERTQAEVVAVLRKAAES